MLIPLLAHAAAKDPVPAPDDVKAGWVAFAVFIALGIAVAVLGISLSRHLRTVRANAERGDVFDPSPERPSKAPRIPTQAERDAEAGTTGPDPRST
ncbi:MAG: hypothetical protein JWR42_1462 [Marmoricola sp.]|nr:hypothetical protein [Marmoricola sp.]